MAGKWLDTEIVFKGTIPDDISTTGVQGEETALFNPFRAIDRRDGKDLDNNDALIRILKNSEIAISLKTIGNAFFPRVVTIGVTPTVIIEPNRYPRGYAIINPNSTTSGVTNLVTVFASTVFAAGDTFSGAFNVSGYGGAAFFLNITASTAASMQVNLQTLDPVSGNWFIAQNDIFAAAVAAGQYYAPVGSLGIDNQMRLMVRVVGGTVTASIGASLKPALAAVVAGPSVFIGPAEVNTTVGYPLVSGQQERFWLRENTALYGIAVAAQNVNVFELQ